MEFSAKQIAEFLHGTIEGAEDIKVSDISRIEEGREGTITFLSNEKYTSYIYTTQASVVIVNNTFVAEKPIAATLIRVENAYDSLAQLLKLQQSVQPQKTGISPLAFVAESAKIGQNAYIAPFVYVGDQCQVGDNTQLYPHVYLAEAVTVGSHCTLHTGVKVGDHSQIGNRCVLQPGAVIGFDGFGFAPCPDGSYNKLPQIGNVVIEDDVEIQANSVVDRATIGNTIIRKGVKLDNLVQVAHNVEIGDNTVIASQTGVAGSTKIGKNCIIAGQVGFAGHISIADGSIFGAQAGVPNSIKEKGIYQGTPAVPITTFHRSSVVYKNLSDLQKLVYQLKRDIETLKNNNPQL